MFGTIISFLGKVLFWVIVYILSATALGLLILFILFICLGKGDVKYTYSKEDEADQLRAIEEYNKKREEKLAKKQKK